MSRRARADAESGQVATVAAVKAPGESRQAPFQVRGSLQTVLSLRLLAPDDPQLHPAAARQDRALAGFLPQRAVGARRGRRSLEQPPLDLEPAGRASAPAAADAGRASRTARPEWNEAAMAAGLAVFGAGSAPRSRPERRPPAASGAGRPHAAARRRARRPAASSPSRCAAASRSSPTAISWSPPPVSAGAELAAIGPHPRLRHAARPGLRRHRGRRGRADLLRPARGRAAVDRRACIW